MWVYQDGWRIWQSVAPLQLLPISFFFSFLLFFLLWIIVLSTYHKCYKTFLFSQLLTFILSTLTDVSPLGIITDPRIKNIFSLHGHSYYTHNILTALWSFLNIRSLIKLFYIVVIIFSVRGTQNCNHIQKKIEWTLQHSYFLTTSWQDINRPLFSVHCPSPSLCHFHHSFPPPLFLAAETQNSGKSSMITDQRKGLQELLFTILNVKQ